MQLRPGMPPLPEQMRSLPLDARGYPVPYFVAWIDGAPDFRIADAAKAHRCVTESRCWLCGGRLGTFLAFVVGPMCAINRISSEPPSHRACAEFAVRVCPFLVRPMAQRREAGVPEAAARPAGVMLRRNPGVSLLWVTKDYQTVRAPRPDGSVGLLYQMGEPRELVCYAEGRIATKDEVRASVDSGLPSLLERVDEKDWRQVKHFEGLVLRGRKLLGIEAVRA
jgi:hypothetical protein